MYHYTYLLEFTDGMKYVGVHSTSIEPHLDSRYMGSGSALPERDSSNCHKRILGTYPDRVSALAAERDLITSRNCCASPDYYNIRVQTFDRFGRTKLTHSDAASSSLKLTGRTYVPLPSSAIWLRGDDRTPAQKAGQVSMRKALTGVKNPDKGRSSVENSGFHPWYYETPQGVYVEVHDRTKAEVASELGLTSRQIAHGFHYSNMHKRAKTLPRKGYVFGNLPRPNDTGDA